ncbi:50S ribosomal protein L18 [Trifolium repens]|nr:50S ribosomal protein L18 [Trifolium repens]
MNRRLILQQTRGKLRKQNLVSHLPTHSLSLSDRYKLFPLSLLSPILHRRHVQSGQPRHSRTVRFSSSQSQTGMVIPPPVRPPRITNFLKPYVLKMHFTNKYVTAQVIHTPTATVASSASSQEKALRSSLETTRDVAAAAKIGKLLAERLSLKDIPAVSVHLKREQSVPIPPEVQALGLWQAIEWLAK